MSCMLDTSFPDLYDSLLQRDIRWFSLKFLEFKKLQFYTISNFGQIQKISRILAKNVKTPDFGNTGFKLGL